MSQDQDPIDATRRFEPVDPYNIPPEHAAAPSQGFEGYQAGFEQQPYGVPQPEPVPPRGFRQRLTRLGPLKLAVLGTAGVIVLGGAAWSTTAALQSGSSSSNTAAAAPATDQSPSGPGAGATTGGAGKHAKRSKPTRIEITGLDAGTQVGTIHGTDAKGAPLTVIYDAKTRFGTRKNPLTPQDLAVGKRIVVVGPRSGGTITATAIVLLVPKAHGPATPGDGAIPSAPTSSSDPASPIGGNA